MDETRPVLHLGVEKNNEKRKSGKMMTMYGSPSAVSKPTPIPNSGAAKRNHERGEEGGERRRRWWGDDFEDFVYTTELRRERLDLVKQTNDGAKKIFPSPNQPTTVGWCCMAASSSSTTTTQKDKMQVVLLNSGGNKEVYCGNVVKCMCGADQEPICLPAATPQKILAAPVCFSNGLSKDTRQAFLREINETLVRLETLPMERKNQNYDAMAAILADPDVSLRNKALMIYAQINVDVFKKTLPDPTVVVQWADASKMCKTIMGLMGSGQITINSTYVNNPLLLLEVMAHEMCHLYFFTRLAVESHSTVWYYLMGLISRAYLSMFKYGVCANLKDMTQLEVTQRYGDKNDDDDIILVKVEERVPLQPTHVSIVPRRAHIRKSYRAAPY